MDGMKTLGRISGLSQEAMVGIWNEVKENKAKLDACEGPHDFHDDPTSILPGFKIARRMACSKCKGWVDTINGHWYKKGLEDAKKT